MATLVNIKEQFIQSLIELYPESEIQSIANIALEHTLSLSRSQLLQNRDLHITPQQEQQLAEILKRLIAAEPIQYVIGEGDFYGLKFKVNPSVLIPRPETEELVHWIINDFKGISNINLLDVCTGSGCIAISLKKNIETGDIFAIDISEEALKTAVSNAEANGTAINFVQGDILKQIFNKPITQKFDIVVSNPPYVLNSERAQMHKNVLEYEPKIAVFVDDRDALIFYKAIAQYAKQVLKPHGRLYFEINEAKGKEVVEMLSAKEFRNIILKKDLNNTDRMVRAEL